MAADSDDDCESEEDIGTVDVVVGFPNEVNEMDLDLDDDDNPDGNPSHFGRGLLQAPCTIRGLRMKKAKTKSQKKSAKWYDIQGSLNQHFCYPNQTILSLLLLNLTWKIVSIQLIIINS